MIKSMPIKLIISFIAIVLLASIFYTPTSHAIGDIMGEGKGFLEASNGENGVIDQKALKGASDSIYNTLLAMAIIIAVIVAMVLGIQFMVASADEKAKVKEALMPFIIGCIVVFGSFTIWKVFVNIGNSAESSITAIDVKKDEKAEKDERDKIRNEYENWENWYSQVVEGGKITNTDATLWNADEWHDFYNWMKENNQVTNDPNKINNQLIQSYISKQQDEKNENKESRFNAWYESVQSSLNNSNMSSEAKSWSKDKWHNFYDWMFNNGGIYYPTGGEQFYKQLKSYITINGSQNGSSGQNNTNNQEPIDEEKQYFKSWYNSLKSHLNMIDEEEAKDWSEDKWLEFYKYMRDTRGLQEIPSPGIDFNNYLKEYIKYLKERL